MTLQFATVSWTDLVWMFPVLFLFHDFEEILTVEKWGAQYRDRLPQMPIRMQRVFGPSFHTTTHRFAQDVLYVFSLITGATFLAVFSPWIWPFLGLMAIFFLHVFTHVFQSIYFKGYTPGVGTAVGLVLPYSYYVLYRCLTDGVAGWGDLGWGILLLVALGPPFLLFLLRGRKRALPASSCGEGGMILWRK
ncbi:HXXEE domain-containing protein [Gorillibacterium sp. CAU 1737]|uniref:HXXEE domain-containing protein n=1 Tax=Gorillibacterium sp. CAU 1737 TaxID=3140362 RepID=UPI0032618D67